MPTQTELIAHGKTNEEIRAYIGCDALIYQDVSGMKEAVRKCNPQIANFEASCFDGVYITGDVAATDATRINAGRVSEENSEDVSRLALHNA
jgi:amidophosphoribosyltransferase